MNKFQKLAQLNQDIELLENAGKIEAANILHKKFIKEAQYAMPQMMSMMPQMMMPQMMPMMPQMMMARPTIPVATRPAVKSPTSVAQPTTTPAAVGKPTNPPVSYNETQPKPVDLGIPAPPTPPTPPNPYNNYYQDPRTGKTIFVDPGTGEDLPSQDGGVNITPPGSVPPPAGKFNDPMEDPRVKEYWKRIGSNDFLSDKQKQSMLDQFMRSIGLK
jgi:hypothetical protein